MDAFYDFILWVVLTSTCQRTCSCEKMSRARLLLDIIETDHPKIRPVFMNKKPTLVYVWCHSASSTDPRVRCASTSGVSRVTDAVHNYSSCPVVFGVDDLASTRPSRHVFTEYVIMLETICSIMILMTCSGHAGSTCMRGPSCVDGRPASLRHEKSPIMLFTPR